MPSCRISSGLLVRYSLAIVLAISVVDCANPGLGLTGDPKLLTESFSEGKLAETYQPSGQLNCLEGQDCPSADQYPNSLEPSVWQNNLEIDPK